MNLQIVKVRCLSLFFSPENLATHSAACLYSTISRRLGRIQRDFLTFHGLSGLSLTFCPIFSTFKFLLLLGTTGWSIRTQHFGSALRIFRIVAYFAISLWPLQSRVHCAKWEEKTNRWKIFNPVGKNCSRKVSKMRFFSIYWRIVCSHDCMVMLSMFWCSHVSYFNFLTYFVATFAYSLTWERKTSFMLCCATEKWHFFCSFSCSIHFNGSRRQ